ncbi:DUF6891 domain-containing protein [Longispora urticae]
MIDEELAEDLREYIRTAVRSGYDDPAEIPEEAAENVDSEDDPEVLDLAERILAEESAALAAEQAGWPAVTDCDRIDAAFAALDAAGVVARAHFTCCGTCANAEIGAELAGHPAPRGFVYHHVQDTDHAVAGGGLMLGYGSVADGEEAVTAIGDEVVAALRAQGFEPKWNGSAQTRIEVPMVWQRRVPAGSPTG